MSMKHKRGPSTSRNRNKRRRKKQKAAQAPPQPEEEETKPSSTPPCSSNNYEVIAEAPPQPAEEKKPSSTPPWSSDNDEVIAEAPPQPEKETKPSSKPLSSSDKEAPPHPEEETKPSSKPLSSSDEEAPPQPEEETKPSSKPLSSSDEEALPQPEEETKPSSKPFWWSDDEDDEVNERLLEHAIHLSLLSAMDDKQKGVIVSNPLKPIPQSRSSVFEVGESSTTFSTCSICKFGKPRSSFTNYSKRCGHVYCRECLPVYIGEQINDMVDITMVKCPEPDCKNEFSYTAFRNFVPPEVMDRWEAAQAESSVLWEPMYERCPFKGCGKRFVDDERGFGIKACPYCWRVFCVECKVKWHWGKTCEAFKAEMELERKRLEELERKKLNDQFDVLLERFKFNSRSRW